MLSHAIQAVRTRIDDLRDAASRAVSKLKDSEDMLVTTWSRPFMLCPTWGNDRDDFDSVLLWLLLLSVANSVRFGLTKARASSFRTIT